MTGGNPILVAMHWSWLVFCRIGDVYAVNYYGATYKISFITTKLDIFSTTLHVKMEIHAQNCHSTPECRMLSILQGLWVAQAAVTERWP